ncbi:MAG TPA: malectin domain-containing carbohydrate-binding protein, partial [Cytophagales bacterium]
MTSPFDLVHALARGGSYLFAGGSGIARSEDNGESWFSVNNGLSNFMVSALVEHGGAMYAGTAGAGVFKSTDNGDNWQHLQGGVEMQLVDRLLSHEGVLFVGGYYGLFRSADDGATWQSLSEQVAGSVDGMTVLGADLFACGSAGVYRSGDGGASWEKVNQATSGFPTTVLAAYQNTLFGGTSTGGVLRSTDQGATWVPVNEGFNNPSIRALAFTADRLVAGTFNNGVWYRPLAELLPPPPDQVRLNAGGAAHRTADNLLFAADDQFSGGTVSALDTGAVANTPEDALYRTLRFGPSFAYHVPVPNGTYDLTLHFNETYWGYRVPGGIRSRRFHVNVEGARALTNYDIFNRAKGAMRAVQETFRVSVTDGTLDIDFVKGAADYPAVAALEVVPVADPGAFRVNAGGVAYTTPGGHTFAGDSYFAGGIRSTAVDEEVAGTADDALYQTGRHGAYFSYNFPTGNGTFDVTLHFAETHWGSRVAGGVRSRR